MSHNLWSEVRYSEAFGARPEPAHAPAATALAGRAKDRFQDNRTRQQKDYDRILFSSPVRRLADKTQVWALSDNDNVRRRLTHSHEVANLAKSIAARIYPIHERQFGADLHTVIFPILGSIGLAHDLGNPPFGHKGETAIGDWFAANDWVFKKLTEHGPELPSPVDDRFLAEFKGFDGNPQSLRLVTKLQTSVGHVGLDLSASTLAASLKYPVGVRNVEKGDPVFKKFGYFESEREVVEWFRAETGLNEHQRHPLTWIMEACDDIAYSVLDIEDGMNKKVLEPEVVLSDLKKSIPIDSDDRVAVERLAAQFEKADGAQRPDGSVKDIRTGYFRATMIDELVAEASHEFSVNADAIFRLERVDPLMERSTLCNALKEITKTRIHNKDVHTEAMGAKAITGLMNMFWYAIRTRKDLDDIGASRTEPNALALFDQVSSNYVEAAARAGGKGAGGTVRYRELRLLTDQISGMTDRYTKKTYDELSDYHHLK